MDLTDTPRNIQANLLALKSILLHLICSHKVIPQGGHREEDTFMDMFVVEHLHRDKAINLPYIMLRQMD